MFYLHRCPVSRNTVIGLFDTLVGPEKRVCTLLVHPLHQKYPFSYFNERKTI